MLNVFFVQLTCCIDAISKVTEFIEDMLLPTGCSSLHKHTGRGSDAGFYTTNHYNGTVASILYHVDSIDNRCIFYLKKVCLPVKKIEGGMKL